MEIEELLNSIYGNLVQRYLVKERIDMFFHDVAVSLQRGGFMLRDFIQRPPIAGICAECWNSRFGRPARTIFRQRLFNQLFLRCRAYFNFSAIWKVNFYRIFFSQAKSFFLRFASVCAMSFSRFVGSYYHTDMSHHSSSRIVYCFRSLTLLSAAKHRTYQTRKHSTGSGNHQHGRRNQAGHGR